MSEVLKTKKTNPGNYLIEYYILEFYFAGVFVI